MKYQFPFSPVLLLINFTMGCLNPGSPSVISSPSQTVTVSVYADSSRRLTYAVQYQGKMIVAPSALGITIDQRDLGRHVKIGSPVISETNEQYPWKGVHATAHNHYREAVFPVTNTDAGNRYLLELKVFDDGMAWRYVIPSTKISVVQGEASSWKIPEGSMVWYQENIFYYEGLYYSSRLDKLGSKKMGPPLTYQTKDGLYASITEAALYDYSGM